MSSFLSSCCFFSGFSSLAFDKETHRKMAQTKNKQDQLPIEKEIYQGSTQLGGSSDEDPMTVISPPRYVETASHNWSDDKDSTRPSRTSRPVKLIKAITAAWPLVPLIFRHIIVSIVALQLGWLLDRDREDWELYMSYKFIPTVLLLILAPRALCATTVFLFSQFSRNKEDYELLYGPGINSAFNIMLFIIIYTNFFK